jgi:exonuclease SbcC
MRLHALTLRNFRQHSDSHIQFRQGLTGIIGANGAGKSTVLEGLAYALFGADAIRGTKGSIRWNRAPARKGAEVELDFSANGTRYSLFRSETNASLFEKILGDPDELREIVGSTSAVNAAIPEILGMSYREFAATFLCSQKDLMRLASMGGTERQQFYRQTMGVGKVDEAVKAARVAKNDLARERDGMAAGLGERGPLEAEVEGSHANLASLEQSAYAAAVNLLEAEAHHAAHRETLATWEDRRANHTTLSRDRDAAGREADEARSQIERLGGLIHEAEAAEGRVAEKASEIAALPGLRKDRDRALEARSVVREVQGLGERMVRLEREIEEAEDAAADAEREAGQYDADAHAADRKRLEEADGRAQRLRRVRQEEQTNVRVARQTERGRIDEAENAIAAIEALGSDGPCPTCTRPLGEHYETVLESLRAVEANAREGWKAAAEKEDALGSATEEEIAAANEVVSLRHVVEEHTANAVASNRAAASLVAATKTLEAKKAEREEARARLAELPPTTFDQRALEIIERLIAELEEADRALAADRTLAAQREGLEREDGLWRMKLNQAERAELTAIGAITALAYDAELYAGVSLAAGEALRRLDAAKEARVRAEEAVRAAKDRCDRAARALADYDLRAVALDEMTERLRVVDTAALRLNDFRVSVASGIRPEMEELVSGFVSVLTDGRYEAATLDENFDCRLYRGGVELEVISGGEEDVVAVAMRLATSQMIAERAGHALSLLILDEPFGSQDEARRDNMLTLFRRLEGVFPQLLLISHVPEVQHAVDHAVLLEYDEAAGCSRVQALSAACPF